MALWIKRLWHRWLLRHETARIERLAALSEELKENPIEVDYTRDSNR